MDEFEKMLEKVLELRESVNKPDIEWSFKFADSDEYFGILKRYKDDPDILTKWDVHNLYYAQPFTRDYNECLDLNVLKEKITDFSDYDDDCIEETQYDKWYQMVIDAIEMSGNGTEEHPYYVNQVSDEYVHINEYYAYGSKVYKDSTITRGNGFLDKMAYTKISWDSDDREPVEGYVYYFVVKDNYVIKDSRWDEEKK